MKSLQVGGEMARIPLQIQGYQQKDNEVWYWTLILIACAIVLIGAIGQMRAWQRQEQCLKFSYNCTHYGR